jgi:hypothetical protein
MIILVNSRTTKQEKYIFVCVKHWLWILVRIHVITECNASEVCLVGHWFRADQKTAAWRCPSSWHRNKQEELPSLKGKYWPGGEEHYLILVRSAITILIGGNYTHTAQPNIVGCLLKVWLKRGFEERQDKLSKILFSKFLQGRGVRWKWNQCCPHCRTQDSQSLFLQFMNFLTAGVWMKFQQKWKWVTWDEWNSHLNSTTPHSGKILLDLWTGLGVYVKSTSVALLALCKLYFVIVKYD